MIHRFLPLVNTSGTLVVDGQLVDAKGNGMFVHAMQSGMLPNLIAARWNFCFFASGGGNAEDTELGSVRAIQMEFGTTDGYGPAGKNSGRTKVNVGMVYCSALSENNAFLVVGETGGAGEGVYPAGNTDKCIATHLHEEKDAETGYLAPHGMSFSWEGDRIDGKGRAKASLDAEDVWSGLVEKVDVLAEIPYVLRKALAAATGTKPFIFQYLKDATLNVEADGKVIPVKGWVYTEASFIST